ncbi:MAG: AAA family ATPase [Planctomycetaceae bacterium]
MKLTIPIYIESSAPAPGKPVEYTVRPLFHLGWRSRSSWLQKAINELVRDVREELIGLGKGLRHDKLAAWAFHPAVKTERCEIRLEIGQQGATVKLLAVVLSAFDRRVAFTPSVPDAWFELLPGEEIETRMTETLTAHLRQQERDGGSRESASRETKPRGTIVLSDLSLKGSAWVSEVEINLTPPRVREKPKRDLFAFLGSRETLNGEHELHKVGRCLNHLYPDDLDRVRLRDHEVAELSRLLLDDDKRPVLLLGPRQSGKTAIIHEHVFRQVDRHKTPHRDKEAVWLLSPQRLISGMSYVGQWESRLHAIVKHAQERNLVLCFDDVIGMFQAGTTSQSSLSVAGVLKPIIERREVRVLAEMTPEAFRVLRERDRGLADLFHILPVHELAGDDNLRVLIGTLRQLEARHRCRFGIEALPIVIDLQRRYARDTAFPGKGATFLRRLAIKAANAETPIAREQVIAAFHEQTGLPRSFLDQRQSLSPDDVKHALRERFVGQNEAVEAAVEIIGLAKARLNDPARPLASLLLLGPTGVGKTQFAKSLAAYLFGHFDRLLRFDMNEYVSASAVPQLVGTFAQPEGLLTSAVRRQPFAVVLFDEIEKGHPDIFDLLLQVLGEGRLTDSQGRTADFTNTIIVLTSNLGAQRSATGLGFGSRDEDLQRVSIRAAENFFRPEFFNRLDRVIPFDRIAREDLQHIARLLIDNVLRREGLVRRRCVLNIAPAALEWIIDQGHDPALGARALKRSIERELTRPIAEYLAGMTSKNADVLSGTALAAGDSPDDVDPERPVASAMPLKEADLVTLIDLQLGDRGLSVSVTELCRRLESNASEHADDVTVLADCQSRLAALKAALPELRPHGDLIAGQGTPAQSRYLILQDECLQIATWLDELSIAIRLAAESGSTSKTRSPPGRVVKAGWDKSGWREISHGSASREFDADDEIAEFLSDGNLPTLTRPVDVPRELMQVTRRLNWLETLATANDGRLTEEVTVRLKLLDRLRVEVLDRFVAGYLAAWSADMGLESRRMPESETGDNERVLLVSGLLAQSFVVAESGYHLLRTTPQSPPRLLLVATDQPATDLIREYDESDSQLTPLSVELLCDAAFGSLSNPKR